jgi:8-oxo-dGTP pyrophosphatase MutT (NUDIX family)
MQHNVLGWPIVTARNCFDTVRSIGVRAWPKISEPVGIVDFLATATDTERVDYNRFAPKSFAVKHRNPYDGSVFDAFKVEFKPYACVFGLIDDMVPITAEWKHGNDRITLVPPCGVPGKAEGALTNMAKKMRATALREWNEETGTELENPVPLSSGEGVFSTVRNAHVQCYPYLGTVKTPIVKGQTKLDDTEHLKMILFPLPEWIKLLETHGLWDQNPDFGVEACTRDVTYAALRAMGRLKLV